MDLAIATKDLELKEFTDVELSICDQENKIIFYGHKIILACASPYFHKMFSFNKGIDKVTMNVDNRTIMHQIILSLYGIKNKDIDTKHWYYKLQKIKCYQYLLIDYPVHKLYNLKVPAEGFELLQQVLEQYGLSKNKGLARVIQNNIPDGYDKNILPDIIVNALDEPNNNICGADFFYSKCGNFAASFIFNKNKNCIIEITDMNQFMCIKKLEYVNPIKKICFSSNSKIVYFYDDMNNLMKWNIKMLSCQKIITLPKNFVVRNKNLTDFRIIDDEKSVIFKDKYGSTFTFHIK